MIRSYPPNGGNYCPNRNGIQHKSRLHFFDQAIDQAMADHSFFPIFLHQTIRFCTLYPKASKPLKCARNFNIFHLNTIEFNLESCQNVFNQMFLDSKIS